MQAGAAPKDPPLIQELPSSRNGRRGNGRRKRTGPAYEGRARPSLQRARSLTAQGASHASEG